LKMTRGCAKVQVMEKQAVLEKLRAHEAELRAAGIVHLRLFGSVARGDNGAESDVDLLADFDPENYPSLFTVVGLEYRLSDLVGGEVHLSSSGGMRRRIMDRITREAEFAF